MTMKTNNLLPQRVTTILIAQPKANVGSLKFAMFGKSYLLMHFGHLFLCFQQNNEDAIK